MTIIQLQEEIQKNIIKDSIPKALEILDEHLLASSPQKEDLLKLMRRSSSIERQRRNRSRPDHELEIEINRIVDSLFDLLKEISEQDINKQNSGKTYGQIKDPILAISPTQEKRDQLQELLDRLRFTNAKVIVASSYQAIPDSYRVLIFDNTDLVAPKDRNAPPSKEINDRVALMEAYRSNPAAHGIDLFHYGSIFLPYLNQAEVSNRFQRANSKFTLYARLKELLDFIRTYDGKFI